MNSIIEKIFHVKERGSTFHREILGGLTTFATIAYVAIVLPVFYEHVGIPKDVAVSAVVLIVCIGTLLMGLLANIPMVVGPGLGLAAYFAYTVYDPETMLWPEAMAATVISGCILLLIVIFDVWRLIVEAVPVVLRLSITAGIGMFLAFIGLKNGGVIVAHESTYVALGIISHPKVLITLGGVVLGAVLISRKVPAALLVTIIIMTAFCLIFGVTKLPESYIHCVKPFFVVPKFVFDKNSFHSLTSLPMIEVIFTITLVSLFDNIGVLLGLSRRAGLAPENGVAPGFRSAMLSSSLTSIAGACIGVSVSTSYLESSAGIISGARTGLASVVTAFMFALMFFFLPLINIVPAEVGSVALILIGSMMMGDLRGVNFDDVTEGLPAFVTMLMMVLTFSISEGIVFGFLSYIFIKIFSGHYREISPVLYVLSIVFIVHLAIR